MLTTGTGGSNFAETYYVRVVHFPVAKRELHHSVNVWSLNNDELPLYKFLRLFLWKKIFVKNFFWYEIKR